ncbi:hypothetical protein ACOME3_009814 [Neoechinorhynchus agilis]
MSLKCSSVSGSDNRLSEADKGNGKDVDVKQVDNESSTEQYGVSPQVDFDENSSERSQRNGFVNDSIPGSSENANSGLRHIPKKKKAWYSAFNTSYKTRAEYFKKIFSELPKDEMLIVDYSCALQRDILVQGRMYLSSDHICFYGNIIIWETARVCLPYKDIVAITKEKTAMVIPNAIEIRMKDGKKYFFASFTSRDKTYLMMFRAWQNCLLGQKLSQPELWAWVKASYGNHLGIDSDDSDGGNGGLNHDQAHNPDLYTAITQLP